MGKIVSLNRPFITEKVGRSLYECSSRCDCRITLKWSSSSLVCFSNKRYGLTINLVNALSVFATRRKNMCRLNKTSDDVQAHMLPKRTLEEVPKIVSGFFFSTGPDMFVCVKANIIYKIRIINNSKCTYKNAWNALVEHATACNSNVLLYRKVLYNYFHYIIKLCWNSIVILIEIYKFALNNSFSIYYSMQILNSL